VCRNGKIKILTQPEEVGMHLTEAGAPFEDNLLVARAAKIGQGHRAVVVLLNQPLTEMSFRRRESQRIAKQRRVKVVVDTWVTH